MNVQPFSFKDLMNLKPGTIIGGFAFDGKPHDIYTGTKETLPFAPAWEFPENILCKTWPSNVILETGIRFREKLLQTYLTKNGSAIYVCNVDKISEIATEAYDRNETVSTIEKFSTEKPIGMFLGHIIRVDGKTLLNILTFSGRDIWI